MFFGDNTYKKAKALESEGKHKEACYKYAVAILNGSFASKECKKKLGLLLEQYGPFDYSDVVEEIKKDDTPEHCGEAGHAAVMSIITENVSI
jgi:hypothetical protein